MSTKAGALEGEAHDHHDELELASQPRILTLFCFSSLAFMIC